jgi:hypothetical protein
MLSKIHQVHWRLRVRIHARTTCENVCATLHIQRWRPNGWTDRDPKWYKHSLGQSAHVMGVGVCIARTSHNYGGAAVPRMRKAGERAWSARVHEWNMAAQPPRARCASVRCAHIVERGAKEGTKLWNLREYMNATIRECAARAARMAWSTKSVAESQTDSSR